MRSAILFLLVTLCYISAQDVVKSDDSRKLVAHQVVSITGKETIGPAEVSVAINPTNPDQMRAVSYTQRGSLLCASDDGGKTWKNSLFPQAGNTRQQGDDLLVYGSDGSLYHACIRFLGIRMQKPRRAENGIFVHSFRDDKWSPAVPVIDHINTVQPFEDKPWLAVDNSTQSSKGNVYIGWTRFDEYGSKEPDKKSHLYISRSTNKGKTFYPGERISDAAGDCLDSGNTIMGGMPAVGAKGEVYIVWSGPEGIMLDRSLDAGVTFGKDIQVSKHHGGWDQPIDGTSRANGLPVIGTDLSTGPNKGSIYITWGDNRLGDMDIFSAFSRDQGKTWSAPLRVNNDTEKNGRPQFFPWLAVDPADGSINILFYDRRGETGTKTTVTLARSIDGGKSFTNFTINQPYFECNSSVFFGDYISIAAHQGRVIGVYSQFTSKSTLALAGVLFRFKPGTLEVVQ